MRPLRSPWARLFAGPLAAFAAYLVLAAWPGAWTVVLGRFFPEEARLLYQQSTMLEMIARHLEMVALSSALAVGAGVGLGIFVTRPAGSDFHDVVADLANLGQTFPPIAVFTLAVPLLGFGFEPTVLALTLYGVLPVLGNTIAGLQGVPEDMLESARGMGMTPRQVLWRVEIPSAARVILAGVRVSVVVNVSTATVGAMAGAGGLGAAIISGLVNQDPAVTLQGGVLAAALALILDAFVGAAERGLDTRHPAAA
ncbi:MAG: ABC transporter permease [Coriobacteriia bacterium]